MLISSEDVTTRIKYFSNNSDWISLLLIPVIIGVTFTILFPWISYIFLKFRKIPTDWRNKLQASSEHELLKEKQKFAEDRVRFEKANLKAEETSLKAEEIKQKIEEVRSQEESFGSAVMKEKSKKEFEELMSISADLRKRAESSVNSDKNKLLQRAQILEGKAFEFLDDDEADSDKLPI